MNGHEHDPCGGLLWRICVAAAIPSRPGTETSLTITSGQLLGGAAWPSSSADTTGAATVMEGSCRARHRQWRRFAWEAAGAPSGNSEVLRVIRRLLSAFCHSIRPFPQASAEMPRIRAGMPAAIIEARIARPRDSHKQLLQRICEARWGHQSGFISWSATPDKVRPRGCRAGRGFGLALCCCYA
jgi:hypothetical protein